MTEAEAAGDKKCGGESATEASGAIKIQRGDEKVQREVFVCVVQPLDCTCD